MAVWPGRCRPRERPPDGWWLRGALSEADEFGHSIRTLLGNEWFQWGGSLGGALAEALGFPQDSPDLLLLLRLLALGQGAWDMIDSQVFKEPKMVMGLGWDGFPERLCGAK